MYKLITKKDQKASCALLEIGNFKKNHVSIISKQVKIIPLFGKEKAKLFLYSNTQKFQNNLLALFTLTYYKLP